MNVQALRQSLKIQWLSYYQHNHLWLDKMRVWATYDGLRRPSSGFILATLSVLEPQFEDLLAFILELNNDPDEIIAALGLNFNPDTELGLTKSDLNQEQQSSGKVLALAEFANKDALSSPGKTQYPVMSLVDKPIPSIPDDEEITRTPEPVPILTQRTVERVMDYTQPELIAVASNGHSIHSQPMRSLIGDRQTLLTLERNPSPETPVAIAKEFPQQVTPLTSVRLLLATEKPHNSQAVRVLEITNKVPGKPKTLISPTLATKITPKAQSTNTQTPIPNHKVSPSPNTHASSLASWVDEFCQGTRWNREEAIL